MRLLRESGWGHDFSARLLGSYEKELHPALERLISDGVTHVYDVGCANGYYVVGLARRLPEVPVIGFDVSPAARSCTTALAAHNGVAEQVTVLGRCTPQVLSELPEGSLSVDCEGAELHLITAEVARSNPSTIFIIECHDFLDPTAPISATLSSRFVGRSVQRIPVQPRSPQDAPGLPPHIAREAVDELRNAQSCWLVVR